MMLGDKLYTNTHTQRNQREYTYKRKNNRNSKENVIWVGGFLTVVSLYILG